MSWKFKIAKKKKPEGFDLIEPTLDEFEQRLKDAVNEPHEGKRKAESSWPIHRIHWEKNRFIYDIYYIQNKISRELYDFLVHHKIADAALISKWRKPGYELLCASSVIQKSNTNYGTSSICRVPLKQRSSIGPCVMTGCISCVSGEGIGGNVIWWNDPYQHVLTKSKKRKSEDEPQDKAFEERLKVLKGE